MRTGISRVGYRPDSIVEAIAQSNMNVVRRLYMKRRETSGEFESDWQLISSDRVKKFGKQKNSVDNIITGKFEQSGINITLRNDDAFFNEKTDSESFWNGFLSRYRTQVRINAAYLDSYGAEWPVDTTMFTGIINNEFPASGRNEIRLKVDNLNSVLKQEPAEKLAGLTGSQTASDVANLIKNHTDGSNNLIFQKFISASAWNVETTTTIYPELNTNTALDGSMWDVLEKLAESEGFVVFIDKPDELNFVSRTAGTTASQYSFKGGIDADINTYGHNIISLVKSTEAIDKLFNRIKVKHGEDDTSTSYYTKTEDWSWGDSSTSNEYGVRTFEVDNTWLDSETAETIGDNLFNEYSTIKQELILNTKFVPQLDLLNNVVDVEYKSAQPQVGTLWGIGIWGAFLWNRSQPRTFNIDNKGYRILALEHDYDKLMSGIQLREL